LFPKLSDCLVSVKHIFWTSLCVTLFIAYWAYFNTRRDRSRKLWEWIMIMSHDTVIGLDAFSTKNLSFFDNKSIAYENLAYTMFFFKKAIQSRIIVWLYSSILYCNYYIYIAYFAWVFVLWLKHNKSNSYWILSFGFGQYLHNFCETVFSNRVFTRSSKRPANVQH